MTYGQKVTGIVLRMTDESFKMPSRMRHELSCKLLILPSGVKGARKPSVINGGQSKNKWLTTIRQWHSGPLPPSQRFAAAGSSHRSWTLVFCPLVMRLNLSPLTPSGVSFAQSKERKLTGGGSGRGGGLGWMRRRVECRTRSPSSSRASSLA